MMVGLSLALCSIVQQEHMAMGNWLNEKSRKGDQNFFLLVRMGVNKLWLVCKHVI